jgi:hypothetical protein
MRGGLWGSGGGLSVDGLDEVCLSIISIYTILYGLFVSRYKTGVLAGVYIRISMEYMTG